MIFRVSILTQVRSKFEYPLKCPFNLLTLHPPHGDTPLKHGIIATNDYDHFRDFRLGDVKAAGIDHNWFVFSHHECFARSAARNSYEIDT